MQRAERETARLEAATLQSGGGQRLVMCRNMGGNYRERGESDVVTVEQSNAQTQQYGEEEDGNKDEVTDLVKDRLQGGLVNFPRHTSGPDEQASREQN
jgi:hypothetical protein